MNRKLKMQMTFRSRMEHGREEKEVKITLQVLFRRLDRFLKHSREKAQEEEPEGKSGSGP